MNMYRKILVTDGMSNDLLLFMTDAPMEKVVEFMIAVKNAIDNGDSTKELYKGFKSKWLFKVLLDSEMETDAKEMARSIGWDRDFDLSMECTDDFTYELEKEKQFTDDELYMLSDGMLALIRNTNKALQLTSDKSCIEALENLNKKYRELNTKICGMLE